MSTAYDVVILGAGIVGAACALECARAGMTVAVIEKNAVASGATGAAMGHVVIMDDSPAQFALTKYSQSLWGALAPELPLSVEYYRPGTIWIAADEEEMAEARRKFDNFTEQGVPCETLDSDALAAAEPNLRRPLTGGLLVPNDAVVHAQSAAEYLMAEARKLGASLITGHAVTNASYGRLYLDDGTMLPTGILINAAGAFSPELTPGIPIRKRKGHLILTDRYPGYVNHQLVELGYLKSAHSSDGDSVAFNIQPRISGQLLIGSSRQYDADEPGVDQHILRAMMDRATLYMPGLPSLTALRSWTGFRAATPDKLPLIGPTEDPTVFLATGHEGLGITTSLGTARLLVDHLLARHTAIPIDPYLPSRIKTLQETR
jgi:glycine/D-amino acid oxidase-like deaminating enzyme